MFAPQQYAPPPDVSPQACDCPIASESNRNPPPRSSGTSGQLGAGTAVNSYTPVAVSGGLTFTRLAAGSMHTCGAATSGGVYCWGSRGGGRLGDGYADYAPVPQAVAGGLLFAPPAAR